MLFVANGCCLAFRGHLAFQAELELLEVLVEVNRDVPGDEFNAGIRAIDRAFLCILLLEIGFLLIRQAGRNLVEPVVDRLGIDRQARLPLLVKQRRHGAVFNRALHCVGVHNGAELIRRLVVLQERCSGKCDVGRVRQRFTHALMILATLTAVALVDQHDQVVGRVEAFRLFRCGVELVDDAEDDAFRALADAPREIFTRARLGSFAFFLARDLRAERTS